MRSSPLALVLACVACGDGRAPAEPDAGVGPHLDAAPDAPPLPQPDCDDCDSLAAAVAARLPAAVPGWALGIAADGLSCTRTGGVACDDSGEPVTEQTAFVSGWALAQPAAVLQAVHEGHFSLDDPLPPAPLGLDPASWAAELTVGDALRSSSGLRWGWAAMALCDLRIDRLDGEQMWAPPGWITTVEPWSNELLARRLEATEPGRSFADIVRDRVLVPLDMTGTRVGAWDDEPSDSCGYQESNDEPTLLRWLPPPCAEIRYGIGRSTLADLLAIGHALTHGGRTPGGAQALSPETVAAMFAPDGPTNFWDHGMRKTNGLSIVEGSDPPVAVLEGYGDGHSTTMVLVPADPVTGDGGVVLVLLANLDSRDVGLALAPLTRCFTGIEWPAPDWRPLGSWEGELEDFEGQWENDLEGRTAEVSEVDGALVVAIDDGETYALRPIGRDLFEYTGDDGGPGPSLVSFWRRGGDVDGELLLFSSLDMPRNRAAHRAFPDTPFWKAGLARP